VRRRFVVRAAVVVTAAALTAACSSSGAEDAAPSAPTTTEPQPTPCEHLPVREGCASVTVGDQVIRYDLVRATLATAATTLIDLGGPGISVLSGDYRLATIAGSSEMLEARNSLFIEEPWVTAELTDGCRQRLDELGAAFLAPGTGAPELDECFFDDDGELLHYGFTAEMFAAAVAEIERVEKIDVSRVVAASFGSVRAAYLGRPLPGSVLWKPFPVGLDLADILAARAAMIRTWLPPGTDPAQLTDRTAAALVALGYSGRAEFERRAPEVLANGEGEETRRLDRSVWSIYGDHTVSPAYLAYLEEVCNAVPDARLSGGPRPDAPPADALDRVFLAAHRACDSVPERSGRAPSLTIDPSWCFVASEHDPVAPINLAVLAFGRPPTATLGPDEPHIDTGGLSVCSGVTTS